MGESDAQRYSLINMRDQPAELLLPTGTITLPPNGRIELAAEAAAAPQIQELCRRRLLTLRPVAPAAEPERIVGPAKGGEAPPEEPPARRTRRRER